jgi:PadR family transcriptional regulator PadR
MSDDRSELLQGTLHLLVLRVLVLEPMHGWGIGERIALFSDDVSQVNRARSTRRSRKARYCALTALGRRQLAREVAVWRNTSGAVERILASELSGA